MTIITWCGLSRAHWFQHRATVAAVFAIYKVCHSALAETIEENISGLSASQDE